MMGETSNIQTVMFLIKGNVGPGCLALPFYFSLLGPIYSIPLIVLVGGCCIYNMWLLANIRKLMNVVHPQSNIASYGDLSLAILGKYGFRIQQAFLAFLQLGVCCIYVSFISNNILSLLLTDSESDGSSGTDESAESALKLRAIMCGLAVPLSLLVYNLRTLKQLSTVSYIACALLGIGMMTILYLCSGRLVENDYAVLHSSIKLATGDTGSEGQGFLLRNIRMSQVSLFVASTAYSYEGIGMVLPIENAMRDRSSFASCLLVAMSIVSLIFICFAEICSMAFESLIHEGSMVKFLQMFYNGNEEYRTEHAVMTVVNVMISTAILFSYPLQLFPALEVVERFVMSCVRAEAGPEYRSVHVGADVELVEGTYAGRAGDTYQQQQQATIGPMHTVAEQGSGDDTDTVLYPVNQIRYGGLSVATWCRIGCIAITIIIPVMIPYVVFLIPIAGASTGALLAMIIPPMMDLVLTARAKAVSGSDNIDHLLTYQSLRLIVNCISICVGFFCAIFGTIYAFQELADYYRSTKVR